LEFGAFSVEGVYELLNMGRVLLVTAGALRSGAHACRSSRSWQRAAIACAHMLRRRAVGNGVRRC